VADLRGIRLLIYCILSSQPIQPCQLPLSVKQNKRQSAVCTLRIYRNLQRYRAVSLWQHGFDSLIYSWVWDPEDL